MPFATGGSGSTYVFLLYNLIVHVCRCSLCPLEVCWHGCRSPQAVRAARTSFCCITLLCMFQVFTVPLGGMLTRMPFATGGSGSTYVFLLYNLSMHVCRCSPCPWEVCWHGCRSPQAARAVRTSFCCITLVCMFAGVHRAPGRYVDTDAVRHRRLGQYVRLRLRCITKYACFRCSPCPLEVCWHGCRSPQAALVVRTSFCCITLLCMLQVFTVPLGGMLTRMPFATGGSGSTYVFLLYNLIVHVAGVHRAPWRYVDTDAVRHRRLW